jgi:hypothetical protein
MSVLIAQIVSGIFIALAAWHFSMAFVPQLGTSWAVPSVNGKPLFVPSRRATVAAGILLLLFAGLVAATAGLLPVRLPPIVLSTLSCALALGLLVRALGWCKSVGVSKRLRGSRFATLDTWVYSPLCLLLAMGVGVVALHNGA